MTFTRVTKKKQLKTNPGNGGGDTSEKDRYEAVMNELNNSEDNIIQLHTYEFFQIRALCDEIMGNLCQAKALLEPVNEGDFFQRLDVEVLRHYFYALDTIIDGALEAKDEICHVIDGWEQQGRVKQTTSKRDE